MDMDKKILVVDDEDKIRKMVCDYMNAVGFETVAAKDGVDAVRTAEKEEPDLIIMDVMMPGIDGVDAVRRIREKSTVPVIMLTAKAEEGDKLLGLEMGADDYVTKPFSLKELAARVRAQLRRSGFSQSTDQDIELSKEIKLKDLVLNPEKMTLYRGDEKLNITSVQFTILQHFMENPGRVFTRIQILNSFQEDLFEGYERTIDVHIKNIRKAIEKIPSKPEYIQTVWGVGYKFAEV